MRKLTIKGFQKQLEHKQRDLLIKERVRCEMYEYNPRCFITPTVADHAFSRMIRNLFFVKSNLTVMCQGCHTKKTFDSEFAMQLFEHVRRREGDKEFNRIRKIARKRQPFPKWNSWDYLEKIEKKLK